MIEVVSAVIARSGRILLTQRLENKDYPLTWECPGGKVEGDESHHDALRREIREELGTECRVIAPSALWCDKVTDEIFLLMYRVELAWMPRAEEKQGIGWFLPAEMKALGLTPGNKRALPALARAVSASVVFDAPKTFEVWIEGWAATCESGPAQFRGQVRARSFQEACDAVFKDEELYDRERRTYWGCRLFDNERDARREFG